VLGAFENLALESVDIELDEVDARNSGLSQIGVEAN
jgi:hypothetical protein